MQTTIGLFSTYEDAADALNALRRNGIDPDDINVIVNKDIADSHVETGEDPTTPVLQPRDGIPEQGVLDDLIAGQVAHDLSDVGEVYAAGEIAGVIAATAARTSTGSRQLETALAEFAIPQERAEAMAEGVADGGVLTLVRTRDEEAPAVEDTMWEPADVTLAV